MAPSSRFRQEAEQQFEQAGKELDSAINALPENERLPHDSTVHQYINLARTLSIKIHRGNRRRGRVRWWPRKKSYRGNRRPGQEEIGGMWGSGLADQVLAGDSGSHGRQEVLRPVMNFNGQERRGPPSHWPGFFIQGVMADPTSKLGWQKKN